MAEEPWLRLEHAYGINTFVDDEYTSTVDNVTNDEDGDKGNQRIFYACGTVGVVHNLATNSQVLLQAHVNTISSTSASANRRWLATGDRGDDSLLAVWDATTGKAVRTLFAPHQGGVDVLAMSPSGTVVASVGRSASDDDGKGQRIRVWDWSNVEGGDKAVVDELLPRVEGDARVTQVCFGADDSQLICTSATAVFFVTKTSVQRLERPRAEQFKRAVSRFTRSTFVHDTHTPVTGTVNGDLVAWATHTSAPQSYYARKVVRVHDKSAVSAVAYVPESRVIATGDSKGLVRIFNTRFQLLQEYACFDVGSVQHLSFGRQCKKRYDANASSRDRELTALPDFVMLSRSATVCLASSEDAPEERESVVENDKVLRVVLQGHSAGAYAVAAAPFAHPQPQHVVVAGRSGVAQLVDHKARRTVATRLLHVTSEPNAKPLMVSVLAYDPLGTTVAVGSLTGHLQLLDPLTLSDLSERSQFRRSREAITHICFSAEGKWMATADADRCVALYQRLEEAEAAALERTVAVLDHDITFPWRYVGKYRSHRASIRSVTFVSSSTVARLVSVGEDRYLVEYDLAQSCVANGVRLLSRTRLSTTEIPTTITASDDGTRLLVTTDTHQVRTLDSTTKACLSTTRAPHPHLPHPIHHHTPIPSNPSYAAFAIHSHLGVHLLPPHHHHHAILAHGSPITALTHTSSCLFTTAGPDSALLQWHLALPPPPSSSSTSLPPLPSPHFLPSLRLLFFYSQLVPLSSSPHSISPLLSVSLLPNIFRALGFYISNAQIKDLKKEVRERVKSDREEDQLVSFNDAIMLFYNYSPVEGTTEEDISKALQSLSGSESLERSEFIRLLETKGEKFSKDELTECLESLMSSSATGSAEDQFESVLPLKITHQAIIKNLLSMQ